MLSFLLRLLPSPPPLPCLCLLSFLCLSFSSISCASYYPHPPASLLALNTITSIHQLPACPSFATALPFLHTVTTTPPPPPPQHTLFFPTPFSHLPPPWVVECASSHTCSLSPFSTIVELAALCGSAPTKNPLYQMSLQLWRVYAGRGHRTKGQDGGLGGKRGGEAILPRAFCVCKISATGLAEKPSFLVD